MSDPTYYIPLDLVHVWWYREHVWWCLMHVWWCPVVSMYIDRFELIDVYGQISHPVHVTDAAKMLMLLMLPMLLMD